MLLDALKESDVRFFFPVDDTSSRTVIPPVDFISGSGVTGVYHPAGTLRSPYDVLVVVDSPLLGKVEHTLRIDAADAREAHQSVASFAVSQAIRDTHVQEAHRLFNGQE